MDYDIIGDIHGHAEELVDLLSKLGYRKNGRVWRQDGHTAIFVGDFIDRGVGQLETLDIVRPMIDEQAALAVMGNHEFNAIAWHTRDPKDHRKFLREHLPKKQEQHQAFLDATAGQPDQGKDLVNWFYQLPLWIDLPELRVVHACWHPTYMLALAPLLEPGQRLNKGLVEAASRRGSPEFEAIEAILKGPEVKLPKGVSFKVGGEERHEARTRWWDTEAVTFRESAIVDTATRAELPETDVPEELRFGYHGDQPVFIGHYWWGGTLEPIAPRVACVDYSVGRTGPLVAYRWRGEKGLDSANFIST